MPVPDFQTLMLPVLKALSAREETRLSEVRIRAFWPADVQICV